LIGNALSHLFQVTRYIRQLDSQRADARSQLGNQSSVVRCTRIIHRPDYAPAHPTQVCVAPHNWCNAQSVQSLEHPVSRLASVASLNEQARGTQRLGKLGLDARRLPARNMLQMQGWPGQNLQATLEHAAGCTDTGLVLIEPIRRAVVAHADVDS